MIAIAIILALSAIFIATIHKFWQNIIGWIKKAYDKIKQALGIAVEGTRTFITNTREGLQNKAKYYSRDKVTKEWQEMVYTKKVDESEVPDYILAKVRTQSIDVEISTTEELRLTINA